jgi:RNA polymerase sigma factor (sigma-70 family)
MNEIIRRFDTKARQIAVAVCRREANHCDVANAARLALVRAVRRHCVEQRGFTSYAVKFMIGAARRESRRVAYPREICFPGPDVALVIDHKPSVLRLTAYGSTDQGGWDAGRIAKIIASLPQPQQTLLAERYIHDMDLVGIARLHGSSVSAVSQRLATIHRRLTSVLSSFSPTPQPDPEAGVQPGQP